MRNTKKRIKRNKRRTRKYSSRLTGGSNTSSVSSSGSKGSFFRQGLTRMAKRTGFAGNSRADRTRMHFPGVKLPTSTEFHSNIERQVTGVNPSSDTNRQPKTFEVSTMEPAIPVSYTHLTLPTNREV